MMEELLLQIFYQLEQKLPFAVSRNAGGGNVIGFLQKDATLYQTVDFRESGFVFAPFEGDAVLIPEDKCQIVGAPHFHQSPDVVPANIGSGVTAEDEAAFIDLVSNAISEINAARFDKVVVSRKEIVQCETPDLREVFLKLLNAYPSAFVSWFYHPEVGIWMGATPESLLKADESRFTTMALAGTQKFEDNIIPVWGDKEISEQKFVTDFITHELRDVASNIKVSDAHTQRAGNLFHLRTNISGNMIPGARITEIIRKLHPTPAICGYPKEPAKAFILKNEGYDRKFYAGFLGEINTYGGTDLYVNLRCMEIGDDSISIYVGCGITRDSDPQKEFDETVAKSLTMKNIII